MSSKKTSLERQSADRQLPFTSDRHAVGQSRAANREIDKRQTTWHAVVVVKSSSNERSQPRRRACTSLSECNLSLSGGETTGDTGLRGDHASLLYTLDFAAAVLRSLVVLRSLRSTPPTTPCSQYTAAACVVKRPSHWLRLARRKSVSNHATRKHTSCTDTETRTWLAAN